MKYYLLLICFVLLSLLPLHSQDGEVISREKIDLLKQVELTNRIYDFVNEDWKLKPEFEYLKNVVAERIVYTSNGLKVTGYMTYPSDVELLPVIIYNRGGNREFGSLNMLKVAFILAKLSGSGYLVIGSQYRGTDGSDGMEEFGGKDVNDVLNLIPVIEKLPNTDPERMGIYGWSRGGMMTYLTLMHSDRFKAAVVGGGLTDLKMMKESRPEMEEVYIDLIPDYLENKEKSLTERSAVLLVDQLPKSTPILMLHGTSDWRVIPDMAIEFSEKLLKQKIPFRLVMFEGGDHGILEYRDDVDKMTVEWFDRYVKNGEALPNMNPHGR